MGSKCSYHTNFGSFNFFETSEKRTAELKIKQNEGNINYFKSKNGKVRIKKKNYLATGVATIAISIFIIHPLLLIEMHAGDSVARYVGYWTQEGLEGGCQIHFEKENTSE